MAQSTPSTFNPLLAYVNVRLQQGVPIVDADWNELDDIRKFEVRSFLKWFVGDGIPAGSDGFRIVGSGLDSDFTISAGLPTGTPPAADYDRGVGWVGRCLVDGLDVLIRQDVKYSAQPLHESNTTAPALATRLGVPVVSKLPAITSPAGSDEVVYLDVWERIVTPDSEPGLVHQALGVETCARVKREWVVRVAANSAFRTAGFGIAGHSYFPLARLMRTAPIIGPQHVTDLREKGLLLPPATVAVDILGVDARAYRRGEGRPPLSLRTAINALLRGEMPVGSEVVVDPGVTSGATYLAANRALAQHPDGTIAFWTASDRRLMAAFAPYGGNSPTFAAPQAVTTASGLQPRAAILPASLPTRPLPQVAVTYVSQLADGTQSLQLRVGTRDSLPTAPEYVASPRAISQPNTVVGVGSDLVLAFFQPATTGVWGYRRFVPSTAQFMDKDPVLFGSGYLDAASVPLPGSDKVWVAYVVPPTTGSGSLQVARLAASVAPTATIDRNAQLAEGLMVPLLPTVVAVSDEEAWVLLPSSAGVPTAYHLQAKAWTSEKIGPGVVLGRMAAVLDASGTLWAAWVVEAPAMPGAGPPAGVYVARRGANGWSASWRIGSTAAGTSPEIKSPEITDTKDSVTVTWVASDVGGNIRLVAKRLFTAI